MCIRDRCIDQEKGMMARKKYSEKGKLLNRMIASSYDQKIKWTNEFIQKALGQSKNPIVASSFGKDSVSLMHLVHQHNKKVPIVFTNTGVCFRETIKYKELLVKEWNLDLHELKPEQTFWQIVEEHGYPKSSRNSKQGDKREPKCCKILKSVSYTHLRAHET